MIIGYYATTLAISLALTLMYVFIWHKHFDVHFTLMFTFIPINNLGFLLLSIATTLESAIVANDIVYMGGCFLMLFIMMCILDRCDMKLPKVARVTFFSITFTIYASVLTAGWMPYFYTNLSMTKVDGATVLVKEYGFMHTMFYVMVGVYFVISIWALVYSLLKKNEISNKTIGLMAIPEGISILAYLVQIFSPLKFSLLPASYVFAQIFFILIVPPPE